MNWSDHRGAAAPRRKAPSCPRSGGRAGRSRAPCRVQDAGPTAAETVTARWTGPRPVGQRRIVGWWPASHTQERHQVACLRGPVGKHSPGLLVGEHRRAKLRYRAGRASKSAMSAAPRWFQASTSVRRPTTKAAASVIASSRWRTCGRTGCGGGECAITIRPGQHGTDERVPGRRVVERGRRRRARPVETLAVGPVPAARSSPR